MPPPNFTHTHLATYFMHRPSVHTFRLGKKDFAQVANKLVRALLHCIRLYSALLGMVYQWVYILTQFLTGHCFLIPILYKYDEPSYADMSIMVVSRQMCRFFDLNQKKAQWCIVNCRAFTMVSSINLLALLSPGLQQPLCGIFKGVYKIKPLQSRINH